MHIYMYIYKILDDDTVLNYIMSYSFVCDSLNYMGNKHSSATPPDEHSQGERLHNLLHQRDYTYKLMIKYLLLVHCATRTW